MVEYLRRSGSPSTFEAQFTNPDGSFWSMAKILDHIRAEQSKADVALANYLKQTLEGPQLSQLVGYRKGSDKKEMRDAKAIARRARKVGITAIPSAGPVPHGPLPDIPPAVSDVTTVAGRSQSQWVPGSD